MYLWQNLNEADAEDALIAQHSLNVLEHMRAQGALTDFNCMLSILLML